MATTTTATAGTFQNKVGSQDFVHYENSTGTVVYSINASGVPNVVDGQTTAGLGVSPVINSTVVANTTTNIAATNLITSAPAGTYRISATVNVTTAGTNAAPVVHVLYSNLAITNASTTVCTVAVTAATAVAGGVTLFNTTTTGAIAYSVTGVTTSGSLGYNAAIVLEQMA